MTKRNKTIQNKNFLNKITHGDSVELLSKLEDNSIDIVLTDPPYFLDKLDDNWNPNDVKKKTKQQRVKSLPAGMQFSQKQGKTFYNWYLKISEELLRVLKPGGFFFSFSSPRLYHRMASAIDDAGFEIRDCFLWLYTENQPKAMSLNHFIDRMDIPDKDKKTLKNKLKGWKTPQIKSCFEPISMAQKPRNKTFLKNIIKNDVGLFNTKVKVGNNMFPSNILIVEEMDNTLDKYFLIKKPKKSEKGSFNNHLTVKPLNLCEHLIELSAFSDDAVILDPFVGSGTTALAAKNLNKKFIGFEINKEYIEIAEKRLST